MLFTADTSRYSLPSASISVRLKFSVYGSNCFQSLSSFSVQDADTSIANDITARLLNFPQVVITSHQAFFTREAMQAIAVVTMENARNFNEGYEFGAAEVK
jgi:D-lactate dehydrogenase